MPSSQHNSKMWLKTTRESSKVPERSAVPYFLGFLFIEPNLKMLASQGLTEGQGYATQNRIPELRPHSWDPRS